MAGTTIDGLNSVTSLTSQDEVPVWDAEASGEPTKKITAQNMAASVKTLGSLVNTSEMNSALAGKQNTLTFDTTPTTGSTNPVTSGGTADAIAQSTAKLWEDVASKIAITSSEGTISQYNAIKSAGSVYIAFVYTTTVAKSAGQSYTIKANYIDSALRPFMRSCNGGSNQSFDSIQIAPDTTTAANIYVYKSANTSIGAAFWVTVTYPCAGA